MALKTTLKLLVSSTLTYTPSMTAVYSREINMYTNLTISIL